MEIQEVTYHVKLVAEHSDGMGYINYVFENLEFQDYDYKYMMCVRFPNWNQSHIEIGEEGFVTVRYVREGVDTWFDGEQFVPYKYTNVLFLRFVHLKEKFVPTKILLD